MLLVVDVGNTDIVFGFYEDKTWKAVLRTPTHQPWSANGVVNWIKKEWTSKELGETNIICMKRELYEETGIDLNNLYYNLICTIRKYQYYLYVIKLKENHDFRIIIDAAEGEWP
jgi:8-oxo-dGTP pyrophosphatase MutT (NUDIX family)